MQRPEEKILWIVTETIDEKAKKFYGRQYQFTDGNDEMVEIDIDGTVRLFGKLSTELKGIRQFSSLVGQT